jgi:5-methylthioadenosine/S-adenosylhomocysteine deaminase
MKQKADIIIKGGIIITVNPENKILENHAIAVHNGNISDIGPRSEIVNKYEATETLYADKKIVMPGLINTHTHSAMTVFRGFADDMPLKKWLMEYIFPVEARFTTEDMVSKGMRLALAEMLLSGTTTFNDMYFFQDAAAQAVKAFGMRAVLSESVADFPVPGSPTYKDSLEYTKTLISKYKNDPLITVAAAVHAPYTSNPEILNAAKSLAEEHNLLMNIHISETQWEVQTIKERHGKSSVKFLDDLNFLNSRTIGAHSVHLSEEDMAVYKKRGTGVAHNPECNMKIASGAAPIPQYLKEGIKVGLGTDGVASNNNLDLFEEMHSMALLHKLNTQDPTVLSAREAVRIATMGGARVLGMEDKIGSLEVGKKADIITLDIDNPGAVPMYDPYSVLVYSLNGSDVRDSIINGRLLMKDRQILHCDVQKIMANAIACAETIQKEL